MTGVVADGMLLFAHGARDPAWARPFEAVALRVRTARPDLPVALGYLEFMTPDLAGAAASLVAQGCRHVAILPLFLGTGGHVRRDLPAGVQALQTAHPEVTWALHGAVGEMPDVLVALADAALSVAAGDAEPPP